MTINGKVVGKIDLYHNVQPSIAAEIHWFIFKMKRIINMEINIQMTMFFLILSNLINITIKLIIRDHKIIIYIMKTTPIFISHIKGI